MGSTSKWLREIGAVRPMAAAGHEVLVLGPWRDGFYPIEWTRFTDTVTRDLNGKRVNKEPIEQWRIFGFLTHEPVTRADCERVLRAVNSTDVRKLVAADNADVTADFELGDGCKYRIC